MWQGRRGDPSPYADSTSCATAFAERVTYPLDEYLHLLATHLVARMNCQTLWSSAPPATSGE